MIFSYLSWAWLACLMTMSVTSLDSPHGVFAAKPSSVYDPFQLAGFFNETYHRWNTRWLGLDMPQFVNQTSGNSAFLPYPSVTRFLPFVSATGEWPTFASMQKIITSATTLNVLFWAALFFLFFYWWRVAGNRLRVIQAQEAELAGIRKGYDAMNQFVLGLSRPVTSPIDTVGFLTSCPLTPEQQRQLQQAVATITALSVQYQTVKSINYQNFPAAIVPPKGSTKGSSEHAKHCSDSLLPGNHPPNVWLKPAFKKVVEVPKKALTYVAPTKIQAAKVTTPALLVQPARLAATRPSFDISSAEGRAALRSYIEKQMETKKGQTGTKTGESAPSCQEAIPTKSEILAVEPAMLPESLEPRPTYAQVCKYDPVTKKKYRRVFVPNRGWVSMHRFEQEEQVYGSGNTVRSKAEVGTA